MLLGRNVGNYSPLEREEILTVAAWAASDTDKPWLCALRTLSIVRPALYDTVCITAANLESVVRAIPFGYFSLLTVRLCFYERIMPSDHTRKLPSAFSAVRHYAGGFRFLDLIPGVEGHLRPARATVRVSMCQDEGWILAGPFVGYLTHLRLPLDSDTFLEPDSPMHPALALQHVVLASATPAWNHPRLFGIIIPFLLSGACIRRVVICATIRAADLPPLRSALDKYACEHRERRLWLHDRPTDGNLLSEFRPGVTFDEEQWSVGLPVSAGSD